MVATDKKSLKLVRGLLALLLVLATVLTINCVQQSGEGGTDQEISVSMLVNAPGQEIRSYSAVIDQDSTVLELMEELREKYDNFQFTSKGSGDLVLIRSINDVENQGMGEEALNWIYTVNGKLAEFGVGKYTLSNQDVVEWKYSTYTE